MRTALDRRDMQTPEHKTGRSPNGKNGQKHQKQFPAKPDFDNSPELLTHPSSQP